MSSVIQNLLDNTLGDGARSTKFECFVNFPASDLFPNAQDVIALTKTSQFPGKSHDVIDMKFKGRTIPLKGQVKYDNTWSCTFYLTQDHALKHAFENWVESLDQVHNMSSELSPNVRKAQITNNTAGYSTDMTIAQMDFHGDQQTVLYTLHNVFPKSVSSIDVDYSEVGSILEVTVEFSYSYYDVKIDKTNLTTFADDIKSKAQGAISSAIGSARDQIASALGLGSEAGGGGAGGGGSVSNGDKVAGPDDMVSRSR